MAFCSGFVDSRSASIVLPGRLFFSWLAIPALRGTLCRRIAIEAPALVSQRHVSRLREALEAGAKHENLDLSDLGPWVSLKSRCAGRPQIFAVPRTGLRTQQGRSGRNLATLLSGPLALSDRDTGTLYAVGSKND
jgi:hypothetical protein